MTRLAVTTESLTNEGGGISVVIANLLEQFQQNPELNVRAFSLKSRQGQRPDTAIQKITQEYPTWGPHSIGMAPKLTAGLEQFAPDLIHAHGMWRHFHLGSVRYSQRNRIPYLLSPHGMLDPWALKNSRIKKAIARRWYENRHLQNADCLHALCEPEANAIRNMGLRQPIAVIPNGVQIPANVPLRVESSGKQRRRLLFLGRLHPKKGITQLLSAWGQCDSETRDRWTLQIVGWDDGGYVPELESQIQQLGLSSEVHLQGPVFGAEKDQLLRKADGFILPSFSEGLPMAILEAWAYRLPVAMTDACNLPIGFQRQAASRLEYRDNQLMGLGEFLAQPESEMNRAGQRGHDLVSERFTWESVSRDFQRIYDWMLGGDAPEDLLQLEN